MAAWTLVNRCCSAADRRLAGADGGVPAWDAAVRPAEDAVCGAESEGGGAAVCQPADGETSCRQNIRLEWPNPAGHQAGESYI